MPSISLPPLDTLVSATLLAVYLLAWLWVVRRILGRGDMTSTNRLLWLFMVVMVPVIGLIFYWTSRGSSTRFCSTDAAPLPPPAQPSGPAVQTPRPPLTRYTEPEENLHS